MCNRWMMTLTMFLSGLASAQAGELSLTMYKITDGNKTAIALKAEKKGDRVVLTAPALGAEDRFAFSLTSEKGGHYLYLPYVGSSFNGRDPELIFPANPSEDAATAPVWNSPRFKGAGPAGKNLIFFIVAPNKQSESKGILSAFGVKPMSRALSARGVEPEAASAVDMVVAGYDSLASHDTTTRDIERDEATPAKSEAVSLGSDVMEKPVVVGIIIEFLAKN